MDNPPSIFSPIDQQERLVVDMVTHGMKRIMQKNYYIKDEQVVVQFTSNDFDSYASAMVKNVIWLNDLPFSELFEGFSGSVRKQATELRALNGKRIVESNALVSQVTRSDYLSMIDGLEISATAEAIDFINEYLSESNEEDLAGQYLNQEEFELTGNETSDEELGQLVLDPSLFQSDSKSGKRNRKVRNDFSDRVVELLEENNRILSSYSGMFESLQRQIDEINERDYDDVRQEIAEMRKIIEELESRPASTARSEEEYLVYAKNAYELNLLQKTKLNRFVVLMAKNPDKRLLVMGFADKSGNVKYNAWLSQQRAKSVKDYLLSMGISADRIVVSYFGDTESTSSSPADRRVELSLIN
jgi:outer membrane protein OmpA-like peptidoglycan-associated protein